MSRREFVEVPVREQGGTVPRYRITCGSCGVIGSLGRQNFGPAQASKLVPQKFEQKNWFVGQRQDGSEDRCPACVNRDQEARRRRTAPNHTEEKLPVPKPIEMTLKVPAVPMAEKPRQMTRDERRLIWAKLEEVYVDERAGYTAGWTDSRVAEDLGIPRAWVSTIRDENFGPEGSEELARAVAEAREILSANAEHARAVEALMKQGATLQKRAEAVERSLHRIETAVR